MFQEPKEALKYLPKEVQHLFLSNNCYPCHVQFICILRISFLSILSQLSLLSTNPSNSPFQINLSNSRLSITTIFAQKPKNFKIPEHLIYYIRETVFRYQPLQRNTQLLHLLGRQPYMFYPTGYV